MSELASVCRDATVVIAAAINITIVVSVNPAKTALTVFGFRIADLPIIASTHTDIYRIPLSQIAPAALKLSSSSGECGFKPQRELIIEFTPSIFCDIHESMALRSGVYIVPTDRWYIERTVWLIAGVVLSVSTALALLVQPLWILAITATGLVSINVALTGFCLVGNVLRLLGFTPMLGTSAPTPWNLYFLQTDRWYLERRIYLAVGFNISVASVLVLVHSAWWLLFTGFVGGAMVWFAATGFCVMANGLYWLGSEPRLAPESMPSGRCANCAMSPICMNGYAEHA